MTTEKLDRALHRAARKRLNAVVAEWSRGACTPLYVRTRHGNMQHAAIRMWGRGWYVCVPDLGFRWWGRTVEDALVSPWAKSLEARGES